MPKQSLDFMENLTTWLELHAAQEKNINEKQYATKIIKKIYIYQRNKESNKIAYKNNNVILKYDNSVLFKNNETRAQYFPSTKTQYMLLINMCSWCPKIQYF